MAVDRVLFRSETRLEGNTLVGVAHAIGERALIGGRFYEQFSAGAFDDALSTSDVRAFMEHDRGKLLGRMKSGTLQVEVQGNALVYAIDLPNTTYANDLRELVERGDINESSFGFIPGEFRWGRADDGLPVRLHTQARELVDVSPVALPAFAGTSVQLRSDGFAGESVKSQLVRARMRVRTG